jgi:molybdate transport system ATP-binding protein
MTAQGHMCLRLACAARVGTLRLDVDLDVPPGTLVIVGPNGAGKSSLLDVVLGLRPLERGRVAIGDDVLADTAAGIDVSVEERRIGYLPQDLGLFPHLTVADNVAFALNSVPGGRDRAARRRMVEAALAEHGLLALAARLPRSLSSGERQRVALARALSARPRALLLDEPLSALDVHARREVRSVLGGYLARTNTPTILVTHDPADVRLLGERIAVLEAGRVTQLGSWDEIVRRPASRFVEELVGAAAE